MQYRRLGKSGLQLSALSFGSWVTFGTQLRVETATECMKVAYDAGVNFFDNAEAYAGGEAETLMGLALKKAGWRRDSYCVSSKVFFGSAPDKRPTQKGLCRKHIWEACYQALNRLQLDYLDLYFCHRPDPQTPIEETVRAMHELVLRGLVMYWGTSEWSAQEIMEAHAVARQHHLTPPTMEQPQYNLFTRDRVEKEYARLYETVGLGTTVWSPLASGLLTGKYLDGVPAGSRMALPGYEWLRQRVEGTEGQDRNRKVRRLIPIAKDLGVPLAQVAIAWCLRNPNVSTVILGASDVRQLQDNLKAQEVVEKLTPAVLEQILTIVNAPA